MKLTNGFQKFPAVFNIKDLPVGDFQNGDLLQGKLTSLICLNMIILLVITFSALCDNWLSEQ